MTSEIRANTIKNRVGLGTVSYTNTGIVVSGIVTANSFSGPFTGDLDVDGHTNLDNLSIAGVTTTTGSVNVGDDLDVTDDLTIGGELKMMGSSDSAKYFDARVGTSNNLNFRSTSGGDSNHVTMMSLNTSGASIIGDLSLGDGTADSAAGPEFKLNRNSASPANADYLGQIKFAGRSSTGVERNYAKITGKILDVTNGSEDGILEFAHIKNGSQTITGRWRSDSLQLLNGTSLTVAGTTTLSDDLNIEGGGHVTIAETFAVNRPRIVLSAPDQGSSVYSHLFGANLSVNSSGTFTTPTSNISGGGWEYLSANSLNAHGNIRYLSAPDTNATSSTPLERLRIDSSGFVGVGTATIGRGPLELSRSDTGDVQIHMTNAKTGGGTGKGFTIFGCNASAGDAGFVNRYAGGAIEFYTNQSGTVSEKVRIESGGGFKFTGQGTSIPVGGILHHTNNNLYVRGGTNGLILGNQDNTTTIQIYNGYTKFETNDGTEKVRITSGGSVNIGGDYTQTSRKFKVTGNSTFDGGIYFTGTLESSGFSVSGGNVIMPAFIAHDADPNTKFGFAAADRFTVETAGNERLRIDENGKIIVATGTLHSTRVLARFGIDCHGMNIFDGAGVVANYGMAFYNDPATNYANGIGFFNDDGQTCGGYIVHQDKGGGNIGDIIMATSATSNNPVERLRIASLGNIKQNLSSPSGTSPFQNTHWYDRQGGHYTLTAIDDNYLSATKTDSVNGYNDLVYKRVRMSKNCDIEFELSGNSPASTYRHVGFVINGDGTATHSNWDRLVFRYRPGNTTSNQIRIDKGDGNYGFNETGSYIPNFFDGTERHILIQLRDRLVNVIVDGVVIISQKTNADFNRSQGWFGFGIYEGGENAQVIIRNLTIKNKFQRPHWLVRSSQVNASVGNQNAFPYNQVILASSDMSNSSHYDTSNYRYNVPISGLYYCFLRVYRNGGSGSEVAFYVNGSVRNRFRPQPSGGDYVFAGSCLIQLFKGEYIDVRAFNGGFDYFYGAGNSQYSTWGGHLLD